MEKKVMSSSAKGLLIALILIVLSLIIQFTGSEQTIWGRWLGAIILVAGVIWACISYGQQMDGNVTFGNVFGHGFKTTAVVTVICVLFTAAILLLMPEIKEKAIEAARVEMEKNPNLTESQIDQGIAMTNKFFFVFAIAAILFGYLIIGLIASLIGAGVTKKTPKPTFDNI